MPAFTPPTYEAHSDDWFFGRYGIPTGISVVRVDGAFKEVMTPWLGEIADLVEGTDWFQGGRSYNVTDEVAVELQTAGFTLSRVGYGEAGYGLGQYGGIE